MHGDTLDSASTIHSNRWSVTFNEGVTLADPSQCRMHARKCVRFAQRARSAQEKRALLRLARTWSTLAIRTEAYEAIVCELVERAPTGDDQESHLQ